MNMMRINDDDKDEENLFHYWSSIGHNQLFIVLVQEFWYNYRKYKPEIKHRKQKDHVDIKDEKRERISWTNEWKNLKQKWSCIIMIMTIVNSPIELTELWIYLINLIQLKSCEYIKLLQLNLDQEQLSNEMISVTIIWMSFHQSNVEKNWISPRI